MEGGGCSRGEEEEEEGGGRWEMEERREVETENPGQMCKQA